MGLQGRYVAPLGLKEPIAGAFAQQAGIGGTWKSPQNGQGP